MPATMALLQPITGAPIESVPVDERAVLDSFVVAGHLNREEATKVVALAGAGGVPLGAIADRLGLVAQPQWAEAVGSLLQLPVTTREDWVIAPPDPPRLSFEFQESNRLALTEMDDETATIIIADPVSSFQLKALTLALRRRLLLFVATRRDVEALVGELRAASAKGSQTDTPSATINDRDQLLELANDAPTIRFVDTILARAIEKRATDIHVEPFETKARIRLRIDGMLIDDLPLMSGLYPGVISRLKILSGLDIGERRLPQDGRIRHRAHGAALDIRVSTVPSIYGESMALRLLDMGQSNSRIETLQMPQQVLSVYRMGLAQRSGLVLVTGPTGSGKTTTLHALLSDLNDATRKIVTVENPVEIRLPGVVQVEAKPEIGLTFAAALRTFLRQDPDVMMVGEIRDRETADVAIQAALTGHLVLSTLHTNDAPTAVTRLIDMGIEPFLVRSTLRLAGAQRLLRVLCNACSEPTTPASGMVLVPERHRPALPPRETWRLRLPRGCPECGNSGYKGRRAVFEALSGPDVHLALDGKAPPWRSMLDHGLALACEGITSVEEVYRVLDDGAA